jgi:hypothetical protein
MVSKLWREEKERKKPWNYGEQESRAEASEAWGSTSER